VSDALIDNAWLTDFGADLSLQAWEQCIILWEEIELVPRRPQEEDAFAWTGASKGVYSAKDTYSMLCQGGLEFRMHKPIWNSIAPTKCKIFCWLALKYRLWTADRRQRHGLQDDTSVCFTCLQDQDTVDHILMRCPFARQTWFECLTAAGLNLVEPNTNSTLEAWWDAARQLVHKKDRRGFDSLVMLTSWMLWKQRNARVFNNVRQQCNVQQLVIRIKDEFALWKLARRGVGDWMPRE
jgi:hypothetical protein